MMSSTAAAAVAAVVAAVGTTWYVKLVGGYRLK